MKLETLELVDVPEDCFIAIKNAAAIAVDRFYVRQNEKVSFEATEASNITKDDFRVANGMAKKYYPDTELMGP